MWRIALYCKLFCELICFVTINSKSKSVIMCLLYVALLILLNDLV